MSSRVKEHYKIMFISNSGVAFSPKLLSLRGEWGVEIGIASETKFLSFIDLEKWPMYQKRYSTFSFGQDRSKKKFQIYGWMWIVNNGCHSKCNPWGAEANFSRGHNVHPNPEKEGLRMQKIHILRFEVVFQIFWKIV